MLRNFYSSYAQYNSIYSSYIDDGSGACIYDDVGNILYWNSFHLFDSAFFVYTTMSKKKPESMIN